MFQGTGRVCGIGHSIEFDGYCFGTVNSQSDNGCDAIFAEGSHLAIINSMDTQDHIRENLETLKIDYINQFLIGLSYEPSLKTYKFQWHDGTPLTFSDFRRPPEVLNSTEKYCVSMDKEAWMSWREYDCNELDFVRRASLCQIGKLLTQEDWSYN